MGTHNRLLRIATVDYPRAYFEIIAIQPGASRSAARAGSTSTTKRARHAARTAGPRLLHFVASVPDVRAAVAALKRAGHGPRRAAAASRMTPRGLLEWQITVRADGQRLFDGACRR
jgi:hypothetical protein